MSTSPCHGSLLWSPDSNLIAVYESFLEEGVVVSVDGPVSYDPTSGPDNDCEWGDLHNRRLEVAWSPDSSRIAFSHIATFVLRVDSLPDIQCEWIPLFGMPLVNGVPFGILEFSGDGGYLGWSGPAGFRVAGADVPDTSGWDEADWRTAQ